LPTSRSGNIYAIWASAFTNNQNNYMKQGLLAVLSPNFNETTPDFPGGGLGGGGSPIVGPGGGIDLGIQPPAYDTGSLPGDVPLQVNILTPAQAVNGGLWEVNLYAVVTEIDINNQSGQTLRVMIAWYDEDTGTQNTHLCVPQITANFLGIGFGWTWNVNIKKGTPIILMTDTQGGPVAPFQYRVKADLTRVS